MEDLKDLSLQELKDKLADARLDIGKLRLDHAISPLENPMGLRTRRRDIARMLTELSTRDEANKETA